MSPRQNRQLVVQTVLMAFRQWPARTSVILYSDRDCQFTSEEYQRFLEAHHVTCSISVVGSCADNEAAESFFGVLMRKRVIDGVCILKKTGQVIKQARHTERSVVSRSRTMQARASSPWRVNRGSRSRSA